MINVAVELFSSQKLSWPSWYAGFIQALMENEVPRAEWDSRALKSVDALVKAVDVELPEGRWWAVGSSSIWGPPGTALPDVDALVAKEAERIVSSRSVERPSGSPSGPVGNRRADQDGE